MTTTTWNGAVSLDTTGKARLDYFSKAIRGTPRETIESMLEAAWEESPIDTIKLVFYKRDCRGGSGEKRVFYDSIRWLLRQHYFDFAVNAKHIPEYGSWKDVLVMMDENSTTLAYIQLLKMFCSQIEEDLQSLDDGAKSVSLAAKWAPSEGKHYNNLVKDFAFELTHRRGSHGYKTYRKEFLSPLRAFINIVERLMCDNDWESIDYSKVPSRAMLRLNKAFNRRDAERFQDWKCMVASGKAKINSDQIDPPELVHRLGVNSYKMVQRDETIELLWKTQLANARKMGTLSNALVVADVSGSMFTNRSVAPIDVSLAFALMVAELSQGNFHNKVITFHNTPTLFQIPEGSLCDKLNVLRGAPWGMSTNFQAVFELVLSNAIAHRIPANELPSRIICISDMQFNTAGANSHTNWDNIKHKFRIAGYKVPELVFWNVSGVTSDFPVTHDENGVALVSGYNKSILKTVMTGKIISPYQVMREVIDAPRYDQLVTSEMTPPPST